MSDRMEYYFKNGSYIYVIPSEKPVRIVRKPIEISDDEYLVAVLRMFERITLLWKK